ncbi:hypothetical protein [Saccharopolyspora sp. ASAGF58]|uniref:hypothetical protein n=1 Tax=Saccharopolyspora sp. ASAGF58 TaxID=2719023 RepID=UPI00143FD1C5|nr:hypothetical protein [Saccharopolyspora sp. ASAGF58]QIZ38659.1 hypothetical protein FDZ84_34270 [Saccharopolyspora sp. ASAGF58]
MTDTTALLQERHPRLTPPDLADDEQHQAEDHKPGDYRGEEPGDRQRGQPGDLRADLHGLDQRHPRGECQSLPPDGQQGRNSRGEHAHSRANAARL